MKLVKMIRDVPEVEGGKTVAMVPEIAVLEARDNGWKVAEEPLKAKPLVKEEPKVEEPKVEPKKEEVADKPKKVEVKPEPKLSAKNKL
jgi:hypothetical protein